MNHQIIEALRVVRVWAAQHPEASARVFGSVMRTNSMANDIDTAVDLDSPPWQGPASGAGDLEALSMVGELLEIRRRLGIGADAKPVLDIFVRSGGKLFSPTNDGFWWKEVYDQTIWLKIQKRGIDLASVSHHPSH